MTTNSPKSAAQRCERAIELRKAGHHREACDEFAELHKQQPNNPDYAFQLAASLRSLGDFGASEAHAERVIAARPKKLWAQILYVDLALDRSERDTALQRIDAALAHQPEDAVLRRKRAAILQRLGRDQDACTLLAELHAANPNDPGLALQLAVSLRALGDLDTAEAHAERVIATWPKKLWAQALYVDLALDRSEPDTALQRIDAALAHQPEDAVLRRKRAAILQRLGRDQDACTLLAELHAQRPNDPGLALELATSLQVHGDFDAAEAHVERAIATRPKNVLAQTLYVDLALDRGDPDAALQRVDGALAHLPKKVALRRKRAAVLRRLGRDHDACEVFEALLREHPENAQFASELANGLMTTGDPERARLLCEQVLESNPRSWPARRSLCMLAEARGDFKSAIDIVEEQPGCLDSIHAKRTYGDHKVFIAQRLALIPIKIKSGDVARAQDLLEQLTVHLADLSERQLLQVIGLAKYFHKWAMLSAVIRQVQTRQQIGTPLTLAVLRIGHESEDAALSERLVDSLATRIRRQDQLVFRSEAAYILRSPFAALAEFRAASKPRLSPREATLLGRILVGCARTRLAVRYLRLCARKWPHVRPIASQLVQAFIAAGQPRAGLAWLRDRSEPILPETEDRLRIQLLIALGRLTDAQAIMRRQLQAGRRPDGDLSYLRLLLSLGHVEEAVEVAQALKRNPGRTGQKAAHFRPSHLGTLLTELQLFSMVASPDGKTNTHHEIVQNNFFAARAVLQENLENPPVPLSERMGASIPHRIVQYWDNPTPPAEIETIMRSWQSVPGWDYLLQDQQGARRWLLETFGPWHARAFLRARHVAEESDFLRLCILLDGGGIYADADDYLKADPQQLIAHGCGLVVFVEPYGAIMNNLICASPGHAAIAHAVRMSMAALLEGDNDNTWSKTGPGLLTRAVATHFTHNPEQAMRDTVLLTESKLRRFVSPHIKLPYKGTARYWNSTTSRMDDHGILGALEGIVARRLRTQTVGK